MYQLVVFDWDGTLMDSTLKIANCICDSAEEVGLPRPSIAKAKSIIGLGLVECMNTLFPEASDDHKLKMIERYKFNFVKGDQTQQSLFDGIIEGLERLDRTGVLLAVATGKSRVGLERALALTDTKHRFVVTRCADETRSKPHPQMLNEILDFTAIDASKVIMVGDTSYDLDMASNAGVAGLGVSYGAHDEATLLKSNTTAIVHSPNEMIEWLLEGRVEKAYV